MLSIFITSQRSFSSSKSKDCFLFFCWILLIYTKAQTCITMERFPLTDAHKVNDFSRAYRPMNKNG